MLKIKEDKINELTKFSFIRVCGGWVWRNKETHIDIHPSGEIFVADSKVTGHWSYVPNVIFDLIQAGLVEKVSD